MIRTQESRAREGYPEVGASHCSDQDTGEQDTGGREGLS